jgi:cold shock CspA family protein/ribosome-associated translation inhibitor RaiA
VNLEIKFREMSPSPALSERATAWAEKLAAMYPRAIRCEVAIENMHRRHHHGPRFRVRIHVDVPGQDIEVSRDQGEYEDAHVAIADAFRAAKRRLADHRQTLRGDVKHPVGPDHGWVRYLDQRGAEYGFIEAADGEQIYFHRNSVVGDFDRLRLGDEVRFTPRQGREGRQASTVDPVGTQGKHHQLPRAPRMRMR